MFENETVLNSFLKNISQCTALEGYFIGTCYDGQKVFNLMKDIETGKSKSLTKNDKKIWEVTKNTARQDMLMMRPVLVTLLMFIRKLLTRLSGSIW